MTTKNVAGLSVLLAASSVFIGEAVASSGNAIVRLDWEPRSEILEYYSCGAADACWVARVKSKASNYRIAELRCDSEQLFAKVGKHPEAVVADNCRKFETEGKLREIPSALRLLLNR